MPDKGCQALLCLRPPNPGIAHFPNLCAQTDTSSSLLSLPNIPGPQSHRTGVRWGAMTLYSGKGFSPHPSLSYHFCGTFVGGEYIGSPPCAPCGVE